MTKVTITDDYVFKRVFGTEQNNFVLVSLLNGLLRGKPHIESVQVLDPELYKNSRESRRYTLDIRAKVGPHEYCNIEIQNYATKDLLDRALHYVCEMEHEGFELIRNPRESELRRSYVDPKSIGIWLLNVSQFQDDDIVHEWGMCLKNTQSPLYEDLISDKIRIIMIELPKFYKKMEAHRGLFKEQDLFDIWLAFLNDPYDTRLPFHLDPLQKASKDFHFLESDRVTREFIWSRERTAFDWESSLTAEYNAGEAKGRAEERAKNIKENENLIKEKENLTKEKENLIKEKAEMVKKLLAFNVPIEQIAQASGLTVEEIEDLSN